jgi:hypothetical protein
MLVVHCGIPNTSKLVNFVVSIDLQNIAKATELTYQPWYSVFLSQQISEQYFSPWLFSETNRANQRQLSYFLKMSSLI